MEQIWGRSQQQTAVNRFCVSRQLNIGKAEKAAAAGGREETVFLLLHGIDFSSKIYPVHFIDWASSVAQLSFIEMMKDVVCHWKSE